MIDYNQEQWGIELVWADTDKYSGRILIIKENEALPYIYHKNQDITLFVLQGCVLLTIEGKNKILNSGDSQHVSPKMMYKMAALKSDAKVLEAGTKIENDIVVVEI